jgi:hypothetical protein
MPTVMLMEWPSVSETQYGQVMKALDLDQNRPAGAIFHVSGFSGGKLHVLDIWESQEAFERFQRERLTSAVQKVGISGQPTIQFYPAHNIYVPNLELIKKAGASSLPQAA